MKEQYFIDRIKLSVLSIILFKELKLKKNKANLIPAIVASTLLLIVSDVSLVLFYYSNFKILFSFI